MVERRDRMNQENKEQKERRKEKEKGRTLSSKEAERWALWRPVGKNRIPSGAAPVMGDAVPGPEPGRNQIFKYIISAQLIPNPSKTPCQYIYH